MKHTSVALLIAVLIGSALADYLVYGQCSDEGSLSNGASIANGNCTPMGGDYYEHITTHLDGSLYVRSYCQDSACKHCLPIESRPIVSFVDCKTTPKFRYTTTSDPESNLVQMIGGTVFVSAESYDNCTTVLHRGYAQANVCNSVPQYQEAQMISCQPEDQWGSVLYYSDDTCQQQTFKNLIWTGGCRAGNQNFDYCLAASGANK